MPAKVKSRPAAPVATKVKPRSAARTTAAAPVVSISDSWLTPPLTTEDRLIRIKALGQRVDGYIQFMCAVATMNGTSAEAKERAVAVFYDRLALLEQELGKIQENLQLE